MSNFDQQVGRLTCQFVPITSGGVAVAQHPHIFDVYQLMCARLEFLREARALPPGGDRNQKRQVARSLKRLTDSQIEARDRASRAADCHWFIIKKWN